MASHAPWPWNPPTPRAGTASPSYWPLTLDPAHQPVLDSRGSAHLLTTPPSSVRSPLPPSGIKRTEFQGGVLAFFVPGWSSDAVWSPGGAQNGSAARGVSVTASQRCGKRGAVCKRLADRTARVRGNSGTKRVQRAYTLERKTDNLVSGSGKCY